MAATVILEFIPRTPSACRLQTPSVEKLARLNDHKGYIDEKTYSVISLVRLQSKLLLGEELLCPQLLDL